MILEQIKLMMPEIIIATGICTMVLCSSIRIVSSKFLSQIIAVVTLMTATASAIFHFLVNLNTYLTTKWSLIL